MKKFSKKDNSFICDNCQKLVPPLNYTSRNHCPFCLFSKHLDFNPGDRKNKCQGLMQPIEIEKHRQSFKIVFRCQKCQTVKKNIIASDDMIEQIIQISVK